MTGNPRIPVTVLIEERDEVRRRIEADEAGEISLTFDELGLLFQKLENLDLLISQADDEAG